MQYLLTAEEYQKFVSPCEGLFVYSDEELRKYLVRLPHVGPTVAASIIEYFGKDGLRVGKMDKA